MPEAIKRCFWIKNQSRSFTDGKASPPPPSAGWVRKYPIGAQVNGAKRGGSQKFPPWRVLTITQRHPKGLVKLVPIFTAEWDAAVSLCDGGATSRTALIGFLQFDTTAFPGEASGESTI